MTREIHPSAHRRPKWPKFPAVELGGPTPNNRLKVAAKKGTVTRYRVDPVEFLPRPVTSHEESVAWLLWGATHATTATPEERQMLIEAAWLLETPFDSDQDTTALQLIKAGVKARQAELEALNPDDLASECVTILQHLNARLIIEARRKANKGRQLQARRDNRHKPAVFELACFYVNEGLTASKTFMKVKATPFEASNGDIVEVHTPGFVVLRSGEPIGQSVNGLQFRSYWTRARKAT